MSYPGRYIKMGEPDQALVKTIQTALKPLSYDVGAIDGDFDAALKATVKLFQAHHLDQQGRNLVADGVVGALTWSTLFKQVPPDIKTPDTDFAKRYLAQATSQVGVLEQPRDSNRGPAVERYLQSVGLAGGHAWCAAFVYWSLQQASTDTGIANPCLRSGGVLKQWQHAVQRGLPRVSAVDARNDPARLRPGMVFVMDYGQGLGHTGFVTATQGGLLRTIEGNTDASGSRDGGGVYQRQRKVAEINKGFIDYR